MVVVLLAGIHCAAQDAKGASQALVAGSEADHDALRALVPKYEEAANEGKPELLKPFLDPDFTGVMVTGNEVSTPATLDAYWAKIQKLLGEGGTYHVKVNVADRSIISGDLAVAHGTTADVVTAARQGVSLSRAAGRPCAANATASGKSSASKVRWTPSSTPSSPRPSVERR